MSGGPKFLEESICKDCAHKIRRVVIPTDITGWNVDLYDEEEYLEAVEKGDQIKFEHIMCSKLHIDLDHIVAECDCFEHKVCEDGNLIRNGAVLDLLK
jgi:hypothetical protein